MGAGGIRFSADHAMRAQRSPVWAFCAFARNL